MKVDLMAYKIRIVFLVTFSLALVSIGIALPAEEKPSWRNEWARTVEAAKKEGGVNIYHWGAPYALDAGVFQRKYPEIKVVVITGRGPQIQQRILSERRARKFLGDVQIDGASNFHPNMFKAKALDPIKSALILPEVVDESKWWRGKHKYIDTAERYVFTFASSPNYGTIAYNTNLVDLKEFESYWDFLKPKWRGKIEARNVVAGGGGNSPMRFFYYNPQLGSKFIRRLFSEMNITFFSSTRQGLDWLGHGKYAICLFCPGVNRARNQGLPVDSFRKTMKEGVGLSGQVGYMGLLNNAPHPNAAKVFINWFLSREGQITFQKAQAKAGSARDSRRIDIPKDYIEPRDRRVKGVRYVELDNPEILDMTIVRKLFREAVAAGKKQ